MGRPPKSAADKQSIKIVLHLTPAEKKKLDREAAREKLPVATLARLRATQSG
jgi:hypothetical protein